MFNNIAQSMRHPVRAIAFASIAFGLSLTADSASAADAKTVAYIAPSLDISYWQWVGYGVKERAQELGMNYIELTSENSPAKQMDNVRTALTRGVSAIVMGPVSSASTPQILRVLKEKHLKLRAVGADGHTNGGRFQRAHDILGWRMAERVAQDALLAGDVLDLAFTVDYNQHPEFGGVQLNLTDFARRGPIAAAASAQD